MGFTFVYRQQDETGAPVSAIVRAYMIARSILNLEAIWKKLIFWNKDHSRKTS